MIEWEVRRVGDVFKVTSGGTPNRKKPEYFENGKIPWVKTGDLKGKYANVPEENITDEALSNSSAKIFPEKTVLLAMYGATIGACSILQFQAATNQACAALLPTENCKETYLYYYLKSIEDDLIKMGVGGAQPNISSGLIKALKIPLPPLATQQKIAAILDEADKVRQLNKQLIDKYDGLTQSLFLDMFGDTKSNPLSWPVKHLNDVCIEIIDCPHSTPKYVEFKTQYPCIRTTELRNGDIDWSKMKYLDERGYKERTKRLIPRPGDIIYGREGTFGEACIVPDKCNMSLGQRVLLFRPHHELMTSNFLHAVVRSTGVYHQALRVNSGSTVGHVNVKDIKKFKIICPPITLQDQFAERAQAIEQQKAQAQASQQKSEELFNSLLQRAFKGGLV